MDEEMLRDAIYKFLEDHSLSELLEVLSFAVKVMESSEEQ